MLLLSLLSWGHLLPLCCCLAATLPLSCCHTSATLLPPCCNLVQYCCNLANTLLPPCCHTAVTHHFVPYCSCWPGRRPGAESPGGLGPILDWPGNLTAKSVGRQKPRSREARGLKASTVAVGPIKMAEQMCLALLADTPGGSREPRDRGPGTEAHGAGPRRPREPKPTYPSCLWRAQGGHGAMGDVPWKARARRAKEAQGTHVH